jgi:hypothetical protein
VRKVTVWAVLVIGVVSSVAQDLVVPFDICAESRDWTRPSAAIQSTIWNDPRYREPDPRRAYQWTHNFLPNEPDSASINYMNENLSGVWTDPRMNQCPRRRDREGERNAWTEIWTLNYHVTEITLTGVVYTVRVVGQERGYEIIQFRRPDSLGVAEASLRFAKDDGSILAAWMESSPSVFAPVR